MDDNNCEAWEVHVLGPDDIIAADGYVDARKQAHEINAAVMELAFNEHSPLVWASPVPKGHFAYPMQPGQTVPGGHAYAAAPAPLPKYAADFGEVLWEGEWGAVGIQRVEDEDGNDVHALFLDIDEDADGMQPEAALELAQVLLAAHAALGGKPLGWIQYRAESPALGRPHPQQPGWVITEHGTAESPTWIPETFDTRRVAEFQAEYLSAGREVSVYRRVFHTLTDVSEWEPAAIDAAAASRDSAER